MKGEAIRELLYNVGSDFYLSVKINVSGHSKMDSLKNLDFGQDSAESEIEELPQIFWPTPFFNRIKTFKKWLVLGRKGSGKSAACLMLFRQLQNNKKVTLITPRSLYAAKEALLDKSSVNDDEAALLKWKLVFLVELSRHLVYEAEKELGNNYFNWPESLKKVRLFLIEHDGSKSNPLDKTLRFIRSVNKFAISVLKVEGSVERTGASDTAPTLGDRLDEVIVDINAAFAVSKKDPIYILVDKVDELWDSTVNGQKLIIGLLRAAKETNDQISETKVVVFLRSDIFSFLRFHDSDKYRSHTELISWSLSELKNLLALRIQRSLEIRKDGLNADGLWSLVFPKKVFGNDSFVFLADYTQLRPRDFIQICNLCRDQVSNRHGTLINENDIRKAIAQYSEWKLEDLVSEYLIQYPFLESLILRVFYNLPSYRLYRGEFEERLAPYRSDFIQKYGDALFAYTDKLLQILYIIGFLGVVNSGKVLYAAKGDKFILPYASLLEVHPAFRFNLRIKSLTTKDRKTTTYSDIEALSSSIVIILRNSDTRGKDADARKKLLTILKQHSDDKVMFLIDYWLKHDFDTSIEAPLIIALSESIEGNHELLASLSSIFSDIEAEKRNIIVSGGIYNEGSNAGIQVGGNIDVSNIDASQLSGQKPVTKSD